MAASTAPDPYAHDPSRWGASLAHLAELILPCLDAVGARLVVEVGALAGDLTRVLADWAARAGARVVAVDPAPGPTLVELAAARAEVELVRRTSPDALAGLPVPDVLVIDGDHNHHTVSAELRATAERAPGAGLPLLLLHDVCWPHGRRDDYHAASAIPAERRHPVAGEAGGLFPGDSGLRPGGLPYPNSAAREGGPGNGVLTAVEDFVAAHDGLRLVVVPAFFGFGAVWPLDAPWAPAVARVLDPWDRHPLLERLEANRVLQLAERHAALAELAELRARAARQEALLRRLLDSSAFAVAERLSQLRRGARIAPEASVIAKDEIRRALER